MPAASVSLLRPLSNAFESSTQRRTFTVGAPSASVNAWTFSGPTSESTTFVARLEERTIISVTRKSSVAFPPSFFIVGASFSSSPIENGEPSTRLLNSFFDGHLVRERERPRVDAAEHLEHHGRLHRGGGVHRQRRILRKGKAGGKVLDVDAEAGAAAVCQCIERLPQGARFRFREPRRLPLFPFRRNLSSLFFNLRA